LRGERWIGPQRHIKLRFRYIDADKKAISHRVLQTPSPSLRDTGLLTRTSVRAMRLVFRVKSWVMERMLSGALQKAEFLRAFEEAGCYGIEGLDFRATTNGAASWCDPGGCR
jgi:hypothetical protein